MGKSNNSQTLETVVESCIKPLALGQSPSLGLIQAEDQGTGGLNYYLTDNSNMVIGTNEDEKTCQVLVSGLGYLPDTGLGGGENRIESMISQFRRHEDDLVLNGRDTFAFLTKSEAVITITFEQRQDKRPAFAVLDLDNPEIRVVVDLFVDVHINFGLNIRPFGQPDSVTLHVTDRPVNSGMTIQRPHLDHGRTAIRIAFFYHSRKGPRALCAADQSGRPDMGF